MRGRTAATLSARSCRISAKPPPAHVASGAHRKGRRARLHMTVPTSGGKGPGGLAQARRPGWQRLPRQGPAWHRPTTPPAPNGRGNTGTDRRKYAWHTRPEGRAASRPDKPRVCPTRPARRRLPCRTAPRKPRAPQTRGPAPPAPARPLCPSTPMQRPGVAEGGRPPPSGGEREGWQPLASPGAEAVQPVSRCSGSGPTRTVRPGAGRC